MPPPVLVSFFGGESGSGEWLVKETKAVKGEALVATTSVSVVETSPHSPPVIPAFSAAEKGWVLKGVLSNLRYTTREELEGLKKAGNPPLARPEATRAALIPINKSEAWWDLTQEERTKIIADGHHISIGQDYLPAIARRLHHGRDLGEPFDFLTWFEWAPEDEGRFDELLERLRKTPEWSYVDREVEIRLTKK